VLKKYPGLRVPGAWDPFELAVRVILGQQISVKGATTLAGRIAKAYGRPLGEFAADGVTHLAPRPEDLVDADLNGLGIVGARIRAIQAMARAFVDGRVRLDGSMAFDEAAEAIVALPGLGPWSAHVIAMRVLREPDAFPAADLGIIRALEGEGGRPSSREILARSEKWSPWRAYAALYLWRMDSPAPKVTSAKPPRTRKVA
jgi:AraC family transcriptional regulator of adaptative response / DNA-3-methyladenine glycosylase II